MLYETSFALGYLHSDTKGFSVINLLKKKDYLSMMKWTEVPLIFKSHCLRPLFSSPFRQRLRVSRCKSIMAPICGHSMPKILLYLSLPSAEGMKSHQLMTSMCVQHCKPSLTSGMEREIVKFGSIIRALTPVADVRSTRPDDNPDHVPEKLELALFMRRFFAISLLIRDRLARYY